MSLCFLILSLTQDIYSDVYSRILNFIQISNWTHCNTKFRCTVSHTICQAVQSLALFCLERCSIKCSIWCSSWLVSWDSLNDYWLRSCFLTKSSFAFHNAIYIWIVIKHSNQVLGLVTLKPVWPNIYLSFKSNIIIREEQIAYKTKLSISCWKILNRISFILTKYRWICFLAYAWRLCLTIKFSLKGLNLKTLL